MLDVVKKPDYARVQRVVRGLHSEFDVTAPPVNPVEIARSKGFKVLFVEFSGEANNISGFYDFDEQTIYVNRDEYPLRQTFTVAHELGHALLHVEWASSDQYRILLRDSEYGGNDPYEKEANAFAAHLLVPRFLLDQYWQSNSVESLSRLFAVSVPMIKNRLSFEYGV
ncbi:ImmA/IrrE family metallo-endopeptidase [Oricola sp.]|uniref:ImmA/IrrE family metallo-endopeptidase n=1 Tax=Oricola sp. TaxID=1979950 RepID=UPI0025F06B9C|nr:ImmA/IrrE family metallo-endopeptidase [Oricola sp.]MCI5077935.1 ImmA/IrrE family metallo-endopeptidase [Oricola sp.]